MANSFIYKDKIFSIGDTLSLHYQIKEGDKVRTQIFKGILIKTRGDSDDNRMITVRKISRSGIGVERIIPLKSPYLSDIKLIKKSHYSKAKALFIRHLPETEVRRRLYS
ncbi:MAG: 50S ribosomal protein L19 [Microgenomates group bacterium]